MNFEKLEVWKRSARLSAQIYKITADLRDYGFRDQLTRAGLSVPSNIAEGFERESDKEKARFLVIAKGSLGELKTQLMIATELAYISKEDSLLIVNECELIGKMLGSLIRTIKNCS